MKLTKRKDGNYLLVKLNAGELCSLDCADEIADYTDKPWWFIELEMYCEKR